MNVLKAGAVAIVLAWVTVVAAPTAMAAVSKDGTVGCGVQGSELQAKTKSTKRYLQGPGKSTGAQTTGLPASQWVYKNEGGSVGGGYFFASASGNTTATMDVTYTKGKCVPYV